ncbi:DUF637 domain-containing protein, partial [Burkholderia ubonensis]|uniref:DUF637 domain-containing protein n=1 Tax=Burkholderia ubonensis TaxID=101571 RepID=UPI000A96F9D1
GSLSTAIGAIAAESALQAGVLTAIEGGSFLTNLRNSAVSNAAATAAFAIGNAEPGLMNDLGPVGGGAAYVGLHAALGCAASSAEGSGCVGGAIGGAASAALTPFAASAITGGNPNVTPGQAAAIAAFATFAGGTLAGLTGQNAVAGALAAQNEAINNCLSHPESCSQLATKFISGLRLPDYVSLSLPTPILGVGITATLDRYGQVYLGPSVGVGLPNISGLPWSFGWTGYQSKPDAATLSNWISGWSYNAGVGLGVTISSPLSPGADSPSNLGLSVQTPGGGVGYSWPTFNSGIHW